MTAPEGACGATGGAIHNGVAPVAMAAPAATGGNGAPDGAGVGFAADGASLADGETVTGEGERFVTGLASCTGRAISRVRPRNKGGGGPPGPDAEGACLHPEDARGPDPYAAGRVLCLACGSSWEARA